MKFIDYLTEQRLDRNLNEDVNFKVGDLAAYRDK